MPLWMPAVWSLGLGISKVSAGSRPVSAVGRDQSLMRALETFSHHSAFSVLSTSPVLECA